MTAQGVLPHISGSIVAGALLGGAHTLPTAFASTLTVMALHALIRAGADEPLAPWSRRCAGGLVLGHLIALVWLPGSMWDVFGANGALVAWIALAMYSAAYPWLALVTSKALHRCGIAWSISLAPTIVLVEAARSAAFGGFDLLALGYTGADSPVLQHAYGLVGGHGVSALLALTAAIAADLQPRQIASRFVLVATPALLALAPCPCGDVATITGPPLKLGVLPGPGDEATMSRSAFWLINQGSELLLGAEGAINDPRLILARGAEILIGYGSLCTTDSLRRCIENGVTHFGRTGRRIETMIKRRLVPLYERDLGPLRAAHGRYTPTGTDIGVFTAASSQVAVIICFEILYPEILADAGDAGAEWVFHPTSDAWQHGPAGLLQHLRTARVRAAEFGLPIVRVSDREPVHILDHHGRLVDLGRPEPAGTTVELVRAGRPTFVRIHARLTVTLRLGGAALILVLSILFSLRKVQRTCHFKS